MYMYTYVYIYTHAHTYIHLPSLRDVTVTVSRNTAWDLDESLFIAVADTCLLR